MKKLSIIATAAALMLGLPASAHADTCSFAGPTGVVPKIVTHLVLDDGTDVGNIEFDCNGDSLEVSITTHPILTFDDYFYDSFFLMSVVDIISVASAPGDCTDSDLNGGYTSKNGNPKR